MGDLGLHDSTYTTDISSKVTSNEMLTLHEYIFHLLMFFVFMLCCLSFYIMKYCHLFFLDLFRLLYGVKYALLFAIY